MLSLSILIISCMMNEMEKTGAKILVVEDNPENYLLIKVLVAQLGISHVWAKNGVEAIDMLETQKNIAVILMDINMPVMDGITATRKIREKEILIPIIFQTAYPEHESECIQAGGNDFLSKPLRLDALRTLIEKYF